MRKSRNNKPPYQQNLYYLKSNPFLYTICPQSIYHWTTPITIFFSWIVDIYSHWIGGRAPSAYICYMIVWKDNILNLVNTSSFFFFFYLAYDTLQGWTQQHSIFIQDHLKILLLPFGSSINIPQVSHMLEVRWGSSHSCEHMVLWCCIGAIPSYTHRGSGRTGADHPHCRTNQADAIGYSQRF